MTQESMTTKEVFAKHVDAEGGVTYRSHWVWDERRFWSARQKEYDQLNEKEGSKTAGITPITRIDYLRATKRKPS